MCSNFRLLELISKLKSNIKLKFLQLINIISLVFNLFFIEFKSIIVKAFSLHIPYVFDFHNMDYKVLKIVYFAFQILLINSSKLKIFI